MKPLSPRGLIEQALAESARVQLAVVREAEAIEAAARALASTLAGGGKVLVLGNGGSAADAQHFAAELVGRFQAAGRAPWPVLALTADTSVLTAISNDFDFAHVFSRQVEGFARPGDVVLGISTSGRSPNVLQAIEAARRRGATTVGLCGRESPLASLVDYPILVDSNNTQRVQEAHITILHAIAEVLEYLLAAPDPALSLEEAAKSPPA